MKNTLTIAAGLTMLMAAPAASSAAGLVPGSGADFYESPVVVTTPRSDDQLSTGSTRSYGSQAPARRSGADQKAKAEPDSSRHQRPSVLVPGSGADFVQ